MEARPELTLRDMLWELGAKDARISIEDARGQVLTGTIDLIGEDFLVLKIAKANTVDAYFGVIIPLHTILGVTPAGQHFTGEEAIRWD